MPQSEAEIQGSQAWVRLAEGIDDVTVTEALRECTELELESSVVVKEILAALDGAAFNDAALSALVNRRVAARVGCVF